MVLDASDDKKIDIDICFLIMKRPVCKVSAKLSGG
jgi:hypothetical protein